jgi:hypothetical protein
MGGRAGLPIVAIGCALLVIGLAAVLTRSAPVRTGTNEMVATDALGGSVGRVDVCQDTELIPAGTGAVRVSLETTGRRGPALSLLATDGDATIGRGTLAAGWSGATAAIPLRPVTREPRSARVCVTVGASASVTLRGDASADPSAGAPATAAGSVLSGRMRFEYLAPERRSWWSQIGAIARRMRFGHAVGGASVALVTALLMLAAAGLAVRPLVWGER